MMSITTLLHNDKNITFLGQHSGLKVILMPYDKIESNISALVLLNLLNCLQKEIKCSAAGHFISFTHLF